jgi:lathosterol oxidase
MLGHNLIHTRDMLIAEFLIFFILAAGFLAAVPVLRRLPGRRFLIHDTVGAPITVARELINSSRSLVIYNGLQILMRMVILAFGLVLAFDNHPPLWQVAISFPLVIVLHDAYFYWTHRVFHNRFVFKLLHLEHHKAVQPTVFTAYRFSIIEACIQGLYPILYVTFFPCNFATLIFFYVVMIAHDVMIHSGVDFMPKFLVTGPFGWVCGTMHHDMHHRLGRTNYGLYFRFWDKLMGTEHPEFERLFDHVHSPANRGDAYHLISNRKGAAAPAPAP